MESKDKVELINHAIQKLIEEKRNNIRDDSAQDDDQLLLSKFLSRVLLLTGDCYYHIYLYFDSFIVSFELQKSG